MSEVPSHGRKSLFTAIWMGRYWQQDQFRSSFAPPNGREISFGVVRLVDLRLNALYLVRKPTLKEKAPPRLGLQRSKSVVSTTPKLVWLPTRPKKLLRNSSGCQQDCRDYSETRFAVSGDDFKYSELVSLPGFLRRAYQGLPMFRRLATWGRGGGAISWLCLSQQVPEPTLSTGVSATVVNMLSNKLRVCVVLGICVLWRRPSRAAMVRLILSRGRCARPPADTDCWDRQIAGSQLTAISRAAWSQRRKRPCCVYISSVVQLSS